MNQQTKKKRATKHEGDIRDEKDPKPIPDSQGVEEAEDKAGHVDTLDQKITDLERRVKAL